MPLEATMLIIDDSESEYMRNGDYLPTRFDAVNIVFQTKVDSNAL
jgi:hypothetical protein